MERLLQNLRSSDDTQTPRAFSRSSSNNPTCRASPSALRTQESRGHLAAGKLWTSRPGNPRLGKPGESRSKWRPRGGGMSRRAS